jgi:Flp pilus assembly pilin Flp
MKRTNWMTALWGSIHRDEAGANLVEYGMLVGMIALVAVLAVTFVGHEAVSNIDVGSHFP